jgi:hypothetical protein
MTRNNSFFFSLDPFCPVIFSSHRAFTLIVHLITKIKACVIIKKEADEIVDAVILKLISY